MADSIRGAVYNFIPEHEAAWRNHKKTFSGLAYFWTQTAGALHQPHGWLRLHVSRAQGPMRVPRVSLTEIDPAYTGPLNKTVVLQAAADYIQRLITLQGSTTFPVSRREVGTGEEDPVDPHVPPTPFNF